VDVVLRVVRVAGGPVHSEHPPGGRRAAAVPPTARHVLTGPRRGGAKPDPGAAESDGDGVHAGAGEQRRLR
jgi:hypothetical protein